MGLEQKGHSYVTGVEQLGSITENDWCVSVRVYMCDYAFVEETGLKGAFSSWGQGV